MKTPDELTSFLENGFLHAPGILRGDALTTLQNAFDRVWESEKPPVNQHKVLKHSEFLALLENPEILERQQAIFGKQMQLLQYDLLRQGPRNETFPERAWHRDFVMPGDTPLSVNTLLFLDDLTEESGPTRVVPGTQRGPNNPPAPDKPLPGEIAVHAKAGDAVFINSAIWHTGGRNRSDGLRRGIYLYFGYWWLKRYEAETMLPWQALDGASETRLQLLGVKNPGGSDLHQYTV